MHTKRWAVKSSSQSTANSEKKNLKFNKGLSKKEKTIKIYLKTRNRKHYQAYIEEKLVHFYNMSYYSSHQKTRNGIREIEINERN